MRDRQIRTQVRMPKGVHEWLTGRAAKHTRSLNGELVDILKCEQAREESEESEEPEQPKP